MHCLRKHFEYNPELVRSSKGNLHILLNKSSKTYDANGPSIIKTKGVSRVLYCRRFNRLSEVQPPNSVRLPKRMYHDSVFKTPKSEADWLLDLDSDDEAKDHISSLPDVEAEIDDFTDVTPGQKRFMKIWNQFLAHKSDGVIVAPKQMPRICLEFAQYFAEHSSCDDDEEQFMRSLFNWMDENFLCSLQMEQIMTVYRHARKSASRNATVVPESSTLSFKERALQNKAEQAESSSVASSKYETQAFESSEGEDG